MILRISDDKQMMYDQFMGLYDQQKKRAKTRINAILDDIDHACSLTAAQRTVLTVASKGAVEAQTRKIESQLVEAGKRVAKFDFEPGNPPKIDEEKDDEENNPMRVHAISMSAQAEGSVESSKVWTSAVEKTLTEEQVETLNQWNEIRSQRIRKSVVENYVVTADAKLFLTEKQLPKFTAAIDDLIGQKLVEQIGSSNRRGGFIVGDQRLKNIVVDSEIGEILTESQREIWKAEFQLEYDQIMRANPVRAVGRQPFFKKSAK
jgi:hypothetical protein